MGLLAVLGLFALCRPGSLEKALNQIPFCDDLFASFSGGSLVMENHEFPLMSNGYSLEFAYNMLNPCFRLNAEANFKQQAAGILSYGKFATEFCRRQCAHYVTASKPKCGERRPPPDWQIDKNSYTDIKRTWNCSDWDLPLTDLGRQQGISLTYQYQFFDQRTVADLEPPFELDESSLTYLDGHRIHGLMVKPWLKDVKHSAEVEQQLKVILKRHPEITNLVFGNAQKAAGNSWAGFTEMPRIQSTTLLDTIGLVPTLESLMLSRIQVNDWEKLPSQNLTNLKAVSFNDIAMPSIPNWLMFADIQLLEVVGTVDDTSNITIFDYLPSLEHFILKDSNLTAIKKPFLAKSTNLISLVIQCNQVKTIEEGAFDHLTELKFLTIAGNMITHLPPNLFQNLKQLVCIDVKAFDPADEVSLFAQPEVVGYDETSAFCSAGLKSKITVIEQLPAIPAPENVLVLDIRGQTNFLKNKTNFLAPFKNLQVLNLGKLGLKRLAGLGLEELCDLVDLNVVGNPLSDADWVPEGLFTKLLLERFRLGEGNDKTTSLPPTLIAMMRASMEIMYTVPQSLQYAPVFLNDNCQVEAMYNAIEFQYELVDENCTSRVEAVMDKIVKLEKKRMQTVCL